MPTYDYKCDRCGLTFEAEQRIVDPPLKKCVREGCTGDVKRMIPKATSFVLKGSGWFKDGYK